VPTPQARRRRLVVEFAVLVAVTLSLLANFGAARSAQRNCQQNQFVIRYAHDATVRAILQVEGDPAHDVLPVPKVVELYKNLGILDDVKRQLHRDERSLRPYGCPLLRY